MPSNPLTSSTWRACCAVICLLFGLAWPPPAAAEDLTALLARPMTPGSIALLIPHAGQLAVQKRLIEAVKHEDPAVRAVAARVGFLTMSKNLAPGLIVALSKEEHVHTAAEQVRALMAFYGATGDNIVRGAVKRLGGPAAIAMAESLARTRPEDIEQHMAMFAAVPARYLREVGAALATACVQHPTHAEEILLAVMATKNDGLWGQVLDAMRDTARPVPPAVLIRALKSDVENQRVLALWHLADLHEEGDPIAEDVLAAAAPSSIAAGTPAAEIPWEAFVREMFARQRGAAATKADWPGRLALADKQLLKSLPYDAYAFLSDAELKSIGAVRGDRDAGGLRRSARRGQWDTLKAPEARTYNMRTMPVFAKGLLADLMAINGCRPSGNSAFAAGEVKYRPDGRAQSIAVTQAMLSKQCVAFVNSALMLTIASLDHPVASDLVDRVIVLLHPGFLACADDPFAPSQPRGADLEFVYPTVKREPRVVYPATLMRASGMPPVVVTLRVGVSRTGCITSAETMRSVVPAFDLEAIHAMFGVKMTPATLGGEPVDTDIKYAVRFSR